MGKTLEELHSEYQALYEEAQQYHDEGINEDWLWTRGVNDTFAQYVTKKPNILQKNDVEGMQIIIGRLRDKITPDRVEQEIRQTFDYTINSPWHDKAHKLSPNIMACDLLNVEGMARYPVTNKALAEKVLNDLVDNEIIESWDCIGGTYNIFGNENTYEYFTNMLEGMPPTVI